MIPPLKAEFLELFLELVSCWLLQYFVCHLSLKIAHFVELNIQRYILPFGKKLACLANYQERRSFPWPLVCWIILKQVGFQTVSRDLPLPCSTNLKVSLYPCSSGSTVRGKAEGDWSAPCRLKKPFENVTREFQRGTEENGSSQTGIYRSPLQANQWFDYLASLTFGCFHPS